MFGRGKRLPKPKCVVITGATAGFGEALALHYAKPGVTLALTGRNEARLDAVARACTERCASVPAVGVTGLGLMLPSPPAAALP